MSDLTPPPVYPQIQPKKGVSVWVIVLIIGVALCFILGILTAILFPVFSSAKFAAMKAGGLSNAKQVSLALQMYSVEYDDFMPHRFQTASDLDRAVLPYVSGPEVLETLNPDNSHFVPNPNVESMSIVEPSDLTVVVMFYESMPWKAFPGHRFVGFADGSARFFDQFSDSMLKDGLD